MFGCRQIMLSEGFFLESKTITSDNILNLYSEHVLWTGSFYLFYILGFSVPDDEEMYILYNFVFYQSVFISVVKNCKLFMM